MKFCQTLSCTVRALQRLRPAVLRGSADGRRHSALTSFTAAEALLEEDPRFSRAPRFDRRAHALAHDYQVLSEDSRLTSVRRHPGGLGVRIHMVYCLAGVAWDCAGCVLLRDSLN